MRFKIKKRPEKILVVTHLGLGDSLFCISLINYFLKQNMDIEFICKKNNVDNLKYIFQNIKNITFLEVVDKNEALKICNLKDNYIKIYKSGVYSDKKIKSKNFPFFIYDDINISRYVLKNNFDVITTNKSIHLYSLVKDKKYIIICNNTSMGDLFNINEELNKLNLNLDEYLIINTQKNYYNKEHRYFQLSENFVFQKILDYKDLLINASKILITDSSLFCFCIQLKLKNKNHQLYIRNKFNEWTETINFFDNYFKIMT